MDVSKTGGKRRIDKEQVKDPVNLQPYSKDDFSVKVDSSIFFLACFSTRDYCFPPHGRLRLPTALDAISQISHTALFFDTHPAHSPTHPLTTTRNAPTKNPESRKRKITNSH